MGLGVIELAKWGSQGRSHEPLGRLGLDMMNLVFMLAQAISGGTGEPVYPRFLMAPRLQAPRTFLNKPIIAEFRSTQAKRNADGTNTVELEGVGRFLRDSRGRTLTELSIASVGEPAGPAFRILWDPETRTTTVLSGGDHTLERLPSGPPSLQDTEWLPAST